MTPLMVLALAACNGDDDILLADSQNYSFTSSLDVTSVQVAAETDLTVDWCSLTVDFLGLDMEPTDVDFVVLSRWELSQEELEDTLVATNLPQQDLSGSIDYTPTGTECSAPLSDFQFLGAKIDPAVEVYESADETYILTAFADDRAKMLRFIEPVDGGSEDPMVLDNDSGAVSFQVDLDAGEVIAGSGTLVDWSALTVDGSGQEFPLNKMDRLTVAQYDSTVAELEEDFVFLDEIATWREEPDVEAMLDYDLTTLSGFDGFTSEGLWIIAMRCSTCYNPAPPFLGIVEVE